MAISVMLSWSSTALAHHPFAAEFDRNQPHTITGTVTKVEWQNPHVYAYVEALTKEGWTRMSVKAGDQVTIQGFRAKSNAAMLNAESFTLPSGKSIAAAASLQATASQTASNAQPDAQPIGTSGQAETADRGSLPSTASPLFLYGLVGLLALGAAAGLRAARK